MFKDTRSAPSLTPRPQSQLAAMIPIPKAGFAPLQPAHRELYRPG